MYLLAGIIKSVKLTGFLRSVTFVDPEMLKYQFFTKSVHQIFPKKIIDDRYTKRSKSDSFLFFRTTLIQPKEPFFELFWILICFTFLVSLLCLSSQFYCQKRRSFYLCMFILAGLLFCYEPSVSGMDTDNPSNKHLIQYKDRYCQTLQNLLQDFSVQQNDWHHMIFVTQSWCIFMKKMFVACLEVGCCFCKIQITHSKTFGTLLID